VTSTEGGFVGAVPPVWWRCDEHADDPMNAQYVDGHRATRDECRSWTSSTKTGVVSDCGCGTHIGEVRR